MHNDLPLSCWARTGALASTARSKTPAEHDFVRKLAGALEAILPSPRFPPAPNRAILTLARSGGIMSIRDFWKSLKTPEHRAAWVVALAADAMQIAVFPLFAPGAVSPADTALDVVVAILLVRLLGWHWAFLPTLAAELLPGFDLFPTWTAAVFFVTRQQVKTGEPEILPPGPAPAPRR